MIRTVIFDLGNVIVPFEFTRGYTQMATLCRYPAAEIPTRIRSSDVVTRFESGQIDARSFVAELSGILEFNITYEAFCDMWMSIFLSEPLIPESLLQELGQTHRLLLLSNTNEIHFPMLRAAYPMLDRFDHHILSYEVGALKPSPKIYREALARAQCRPEECFFTDDIAAYVDAARQHGIDAVQFQSLAQLESDLLKRGILKR
ncbi:MAG: HAD family phosphatase [Acidobacteriota bacterium]|nr:HAD family phosphatase [Acidobacteriota bacterium]